MVLYNSKLNIWLGMLNILNIFNLTYEHLEKIRLVQFLFQSNASIWRYLISLVDVHLKFCFVWKNVLSAQTFRYIKCDEKSMFLLTPFFQVSHINTFQCDICKIYIDEDKWITAISFSVYLVRAFQFRFLSWRTTKDLIDSGLSFSWLLVFKFGRVRGILSFLYSLW